MAGRPKRDDVLSCISQHAAFAWLDDKLVGMGRVLSDHICNAYNR